MKHVFEKGMWKVVLSCSVVMMLATFFIVACSKDDVVEKVENSSQVLEFPIPDNAEVLMQVANLHLISEDESGSIVRATPFAQDLYLPRTNPNYKEYLSLINVQSKENLRKVLVGKSDGINILLLKVLPLSEEEMNKELLSRRRSSSTFRSVSLRSSMSREKANGFFSMFRSHSCPATPVLHCIPFLYTADGCYARAHYMRKLMADEGPRELHDNSIVYNFHFY